MTKDEKNLAKTDPSERVLLISHCLRKANDCQGKFSKNGLECAGCNPECSVNVLRGEAIDLGYKGVCIAPGGKLALRFVEENKPKGIVAVACHKELEEGVVGVKGLAKRFAPPIVVVPLSKDGCVDTEVNVDRVLEVMRLGCQRAAVRVKPLLDGSDLQPLPDTGGAR